MSKERILATTALALAAGISPMLANGQVISACVHDRTGAMNIVPQGTTCPRNHYPLEWNHPVPPPPPPATPQLQVQVVMTTDGRPLCPETWRLVGGGVLTPHTAITQSYPTSTADGVHAIGATAIGWQGVTEDFGYLQTYAICATIM